ncbi:MAG: hypothetical protein ACI936_004279 [Paraglaciecola sp.]|jgi:hypothetical protein
MSRFGSLLTIALLVAYQSEQVQQTSQITADESRIKLHLMTY